jgi:hypothetical protein
VLLVCADLERSDRIVSELDEHDVDPLAVYSVGEAVGILSREPFEAVVVDEDLEEGLAGLREWLKAKFRGAVVFLDEGGSQFVEGANLKSLSEGEEITRRLLGAIRERGRG